ncbi:pyridoxal phosphate-dependent aminotransferase [Streptomyces iranensis]|uniref:pyridoxal phosphate-dependent aminotransferase n=1 Tax=Streptomyces iranensis TaxID=576784 RepID=UPI0039B72881
MFQLLEEASRSNAIDLALGIPGAPVTSPALIDAAGQALRGGRNQYEVLAGNPELRRWIADTLPAPTDPESELTITVGATEALGVAVLSLIDPGDEVVIFEPYYENFVNTVVLAGGVPRFVRTHPPTWRYDPAQLRSAFNPATRAIIVSTPNNPTGHMLGATEWAEIAELCERWNVVAVSDEIYGGYTFTERHISVVEVPALRERSMLVGSLSKSHAVSGWRLGYLRAAAHLTAAARQVHATLCGGAAAPLQAAVAAAAALDPAVAGPTDDLRAQRDRVLSLFNAAGFRCLAPDGGCYVMAGIPDPADEDSDSLARRLVRQAGILVAPGSLFYADTAAGSHHVRVAFNRTMGFLDEAGKRLAAFHDPPRDP